ncbi:MAG: cysteine--tRNA ligase [Bacteroidia bacterium]|nr:cysteine--tRNA ligase [Bacteroidia bacterium]
MKQDVFITNSLTRKKEKFEPINPPMVGLYVCGPTVYSEPHLGHARPYITFDILSRYLTHLGYKLRYVRNITDVGHLEDEDAGEGEDRITKKARVEKLEPMEVAKMYTDSFHDKMDQLNVGRPNIEPRASGHIIEQILMIEKIIENGFAYEVNGSVYFDVVKYNNSNNYGELSGRVLEELMAGAGTRDLEGQDEKRNTVDFALWKKAAPVHIMRWPSPWSEGFPGWHLECSAMSTKYLGETFDIHGGGMDLLFPHHECEIAQSVGAYNKKPVKYWMHNNMITINGQKMGRSLGNFITLDEFFTGSHKLLEQSYSAMTIRFFILQAHYRSTVDFSNTALQAADKGYKKLMNSYSVLQNLQAGKESTVAIQPIMDACYKAMSDDLNSAMVLAKLFEAVSIVNSVNDGKEKINEAEYQLLKQLYQTFVFDVLGLKEEETQSNDDVSDLMQLIIELRALAKNNKDYATSDKIRDELNKMNYQIKDGKDGTSWSKA